MQFDGFLSKLIIDVHGIKKSVQKVVEGVDYVKKGGTSCILYYIGHSTVLCVFVVPLHSK